MPRRTSDVDGKIETCDLTDDHSAVWTAEGWMGQATNQQLTSWLMVDNSGLYPTRKNRGYTSYIWGWVNMNHRKEGVGIATVQLGTCHLWDLNSWGTRF